MFIMRSSTRIEAFLTVATIFLASSATATAIGPSVPDALYEAATPLSGYQGAAPGNYSSPENSVVLGATPSPSAFAHSQGGVGYAHNAWGRVTYYVGIDGPDGFVVPVNVAYRANGSITLSGGAYDGFAHGDLGLLSYENGNQLSNLQIHQSGNFDVSGNLAWKILSGSYGSVQLSVNAGFVAHGGNEYGTANAFFDPVFTIDPAFALVHPEYTLTFSPGVGNSFEAAVPEPTIWALMIGGFGLVGTANRRALRRHASAA